MEGSRLIEAAKQLSRRDCRQFEKWLQSPFFNRDQALQRLWAYITECQLQLKLPAEASKGFQAACPGQPFDAQKMRLLMSRLYKQLEQYLAYTEIGNDPILIQQHLAQGLKKRRLWGHFNRVLGQLRQSLAKQGTRHKGYFQALIQLQEEEHQLKSTKDPTDATHLRQMAAAMDQAYLLQRLRQSCRLLAHGSVYRSRFEEGLLEMVLPQLDAAFLQQAPGVALYYHCYQMLRCPEQADNFRRFKQVLFQHGGAVAPSELRDLYLLTINYCVRQVNSGHFDFYKELYTLYQEGLETAALLENKVLSRFTYHNIVTTGLRIGELDWVHRFIHDYRGQLERPYRAASYSFCMAHWCYHRKAYDEAMQWLREVNYRDPLLNLAAKTLQLKIYYEAEAMDALPPFLDAMEHYIRRKEVIGYHRINYLNIVRYTRKLLSVNPFDRSAVQAFLSEIGQEPTLTEKSWLQRQARRLQGQR